MDNLYRTSYDRIVTIGEDYLIRASGVDAIRSLEDGTGVLIYLRSGEQLVVPKTTVPALNNLLFGEVR